MSHRAWQTCRYVLALASMFGCNPIAGSPAPAGARQKELVTRPGFPSTQKPVDQAWEVLRTALER